MLTFFRGWRRKIGVVTLVMACVFAGGWTRSGHHRDSVQFRISDFQAHTFISCDSKLVWQSLSDSEPNLGSLRAFAMMHDDLRRCRQKMSRSHSAIRKSLDDSEYTVDWSGRLAPSADLKWDSVKIIARIIPYWIPVLLLTLLSAYLLLSKPRVAKRTAVTETRL